VKEILEGAEDIESAVAIVRRAKRLGGWGLLISQQATQTLCYLEYDENVVTIDSNLTHIVGANHSLLGVNGNSDRVPEHSVDRRNRLEKLVKQNGLGPCSVEMAQAALRDCHDPARDCRAERPTMSTVRRVDNLMSMIMRPEQKEVWVAAGVRAEAYQRLDLNELFDPHVMRRWVLRAVEAPIPRTGSFHSAGASLVVGGGPAAAALQAKLDDSGSAGVDRVASPQEAVAFIRRASESNPLHQLFLLSGLDPLGPDMSLIHTVCQAWVAHIRRANVMSDATLVAATNLGGDSKRISRYQSQNYRCASRGGGGTLGNGDSAGIEFRFQGNGNRILSGKAFRCTRAAATCETALACFHHARWQLDCNGRKPGHHLICRPRHGREI
jgi:hypothetical protein